jgi:hypothetical protein
MKTDAEFMAMLGGLSPEEERALRESIDQDGVRDAIVLWPRKARCKECNTEVVPAQNEYGEAICGKCGIEFSQEESNAIYRDAVLIDGHNRMRIAKELKKTITGVRFVDFADREEAKRWIAQNQLGRRNLSEAKRSYCLGLLYGSEKNDVGRPDKFGQNVQISAAERLAKMHGVSEKTVRRAGEFASAVDAVDVALPGTKEKALSGEVSRQQVIEAAKEVKQGNTDAARTALDKSKDIKEKLKNDLAAKKEKDLAELPIRKRAQMLLDACPLSEAISTLIGLIPTREERLREVTHAIMALRDISIALQRRDT